ncbi:MAG: phospho-N-acetylmuramoyl-pentapeptide-transferase [Ruminococcaceae bacterium]|nr:phospho-N-acetylmuramoyl-pentapeptide-transferase [Oscillospiraceae bacterium]
MEQYAGIVAAIAAAAVTGLSGFLLVPLLRRLKFGQTIKEIGPTWHKGKQGTPTMGGIMFVLGSSVGLLVAYPLLAAVLVHTSFGDGGVLVLGVFTAIAFGVVGFVDDFIKVVRKRNLGLRFWPKIIMQSLITISFLVSLQLMGRLSTLVRLPFFGTVQFGWLFYPLSFLLIVGIVNAVNLTDGLDGLAASVTFWVMAGYVVLLIAFSQAQLTLWAAALAGSCIGFLFWNFYPAKVFMGDTGSMFLGGAVVALGYCMGRPDIMIILSIPYIIEALSVVIQVTYFKLTKGKRLFKMTPIHHHFEMLGWSEVKIDVMFNIAAVVCAFLAYLYGHILG